MQKMFKVVFKKVNVSKISTPDFLEPILTLKKKKGICLGNNKLAFSKGTGNFYVKRKICASFAQ